MMSATHLNGRHCARVRSSLLQLQKLKLILKLCEYYHLALDQVEEEVGSFTEVKVKTNGFISLVSD